LNLFGYQILKKDKLDSLSIKGERTPNEIVEAVKSFEWVRNTLTSAHGAALPSADPFLLSSLFDSSGYHSNAIYWKQVATVGQGYTCSDALRSYIAQANEDDSFQDLLDKFSLDLETYGSAYIEPVITPGSIYFYHSPALLTRVKPPADNDSKSEETYLQFVYKKNFGVASVEFDKYKSGFRTGIRQLKLTSPNADRWYGKPEYLSARKILLLNFSIITLAEKWFDNSMMLDKLFTLEGGKLTPEQKTEMAGFMKRSLKGLENAAKSLVLELQRGAKLSVQDMNSTVKEAHYTQLRDTNRDEIASAHRVPPRLLAIIPSGQLGSTGEVEGQLKIFKIGFADPRQRKIEAFFQKLFKDANLPDWQTFKLLPMDITAGETDAQTLSTLAGGQPILTPDEAREEWFTEKGFHPGTHSRPVFTPEKAVEFSRFLSMVDSMRNFL
jgi:hypothetical protein